MNDCDAVTLARGGAVNYLRRELVLGTKAIQRSVTKAINR